MVSQTMTSSPVEAPPFDASALLQDCHLDAADLLADSDLGSSPTKRVGHVFETVQPLRQSTIPDLHCEFSLASSELFQITHHLRRLASNNELLGPDESLHNDKINKLLEQLRDGNDSFELDDQLRTRVFRGRFSRRPDPLDVDLDSYLRDNKTQLAPVHNENKENVAPVEPLKKRHTDAGPLRPAKRQKRTAIPVLQAVPNMANMDVSAQRSPLRAGKTTMATPTPPPVRSPHRICVPKSSKLNRLQPLVLKPLDGLDIFLVDSLTGLINDATQFGTELNASNCEGFPLPEDINEIVQIPTNESVPSSAQQKMALIRAFKSARLAPPHTDNSYRGFYTKREFDEFRSLGKTQVKQPGHKSRVRWADELEW